MRDNYIDQITIQVKEWVAIIVSMNPRLYGGDEGTNAIQYEYLKQVNFDITFETLSVIRSIERQKNLFLKSNPHLDYRIKHKPNGGN